MTLEHRPGPTIPPLLRSAHVQSFLATSGVRAPWIPEPRRPASRVVLDAGDGIRLLGVRDEPQGGPPRGLAVLLHGWEGSAESTYLRSLRAALLHEGWEVVRLQFRDHGGTHAWNRELFHSCRIAEVVAAIGSIAETSKSRPLVVVGYSLGANFALRVGLQAPIVGLPLAKVVSVSPVIDPRRTLDALEGGPFFYHAHFVRKWRRSILRKAAAFPGEYDFREWLALRDLRSQTRYLVERLTPFDSLEQYFEGYTLAGDRLAALRVPSLLLHAEDDPVNPVADVQRLRPPAALAIETHPFGGHCGFLEDLRHPAWIDRRIVDEISHLNM